MTPGGHIGGPVTVLVGEPGCDFIISGAAARRLGVRILEDVAREFGVDLDEDDEK